MNLTTFAGIVVFFAGIVLGWCLLRFFQIGEDYCFLDVQTLNESETILNQLRTHSYFAQLAMQAFYLFPPLPDPIDPHPASSIPILLSTDLPDYNSDAPKFFISEIVNDPTTGESGALAVTFRGTWDIADVQTDLSLASGDILDQISQVQWLMAHERIDQYSKDALNSIWLSHIQPAIESGRRVELVGYSLGAAMAVYMLSHIADTLAVLGKSEQIEQFRCFVYGCPYIIPRLAAANLAPYIFAVTNHKDIVCRAPKVLFSSIGTITAPSNQILFLKPCTEGEAYTDAKFINSKEVLHIEHRLNFSDHRLTEYVRALQSATAHYSALEGLPGVLLLEDAGHAKLGGSDHGIGSGSVSRGPGNDGSDGRIGDKGRGHYGNCSDSGAGSRSASHSHTDGGEDEGNDGATDGEGDRPEIKRSLTEEVVGSTKRDESDDGNKTEREPKASSDCDGGRRCHGLSAQGNGKSGDEKADNQTDQEA